MTKKVAIVCVVVGLLVLVGVSLSLRSMQGGVQVPQASLPEDAVVLEVQESVQRDALLRFDNTTLQVELADTASTRKRGLSGRAELEEGTGMFFVFPTASRHGIWMPDMLISLDVLWLDETFVVVHLVENMAPESYPDIFRPDVPARYVLEAPAGFVAQHDIRVGATTTLEPLE